jgi:hypothetical protein
MSDIDNYFDNTPPASGPDFTKEPHTWFAYVIDGEVAWIHVMPDSFEHFHSVLSSNPLVVKVPSKIGPSIALGWEYDGKNFTNPE